MARKRTPCEWCEDDIFQSTEGRCAGHQLMLESYPFNNFMAVTSYAFSEDGETDELNLTIEMHYCPVCGRSLDF